MIKTIRQSADLQRLNLLKIYDLYTHDSLWFLKNWPKIYLLFYSEFVE